MKEIMNEWRNYTSKVIKEETGGVMARVAFAGSSQLTSNIVPKELLNNIASLAGVDIKAAETIVDNFINILTEMVGPTVEKNPVFQRTAINILFNLISLGDVGRKVFNILKIGVRYAPVISILFDSITIAEQLYILIGEMEKAKSHRETPHYSQTKALAEIRKFDNLINNRGYNVMLNQMNKYSYNALKNNFNLASQFFPNTKEFYPNITKILDDYVQRNTRKEGEPVALPDEN